MSEQKRPRRTVFGHNLWFLFVFLAWVANSGFRLYFAYLSMTGTQLLDVHVSQLTVQILDLMFISLGVGGLIVAAGLWLNTRRGLTGTLAVSVATIVFDVWGLTIQITAALGFIVPVMTIGYLLVVKPRLAVLSEGAGAQAPGPIGGV
ncbi:MAG: hypothetical protein JSW05_12905 [Candidatus Thorarchaeota archaeon]|nr:MAG: hypothetical protein JSW05_12905 [Candidatus Thorarchaeota archaeon]